jgi:hypothetical protein
VKGSNKVLTPKLFKRNVNLMFVFLIVFLSNCNAVPLQRPAPQPQAPQVELPTAAVTVEKQAEILAPSQAPAATPTVFFPLINKVGDNFFGIYLKQYWTRENVQTQMPIADKAAGKKHTSVGWFIDLEDIAFSGPDFNMDKNNLHRQLEELWRGGYISFVNVGTTATAGQILAGQRDREIGYMAEFYKVWVDKGEGRKAMITLLQEMNGDWTEYGKHSTSAEYKAAYRYILNIFTQKGVKRDQVWWVFAPNGAHDPNLPERAFEYYYPGDDVVDIVGFSAYNYGYCPSTVHISGKWDTYQQIFEPYVSRMQVMAPSKPVIIAETATTSYYNYNQSSDEAKNQWLIENYNLLAANPAVIGVYYFSFTDFDGFECDFEVSHSGQYVSGYRTAISNPRYQYMTFGELTNVILKFPAAVNKP